MGGGRDADTAIMPMRDAMEGGRGMDTIRMDGEKDIRTTGGSIITDISGRLAAWPNV